MFIKTMKRRHNRTGTGAQATADGQRFKQSNVYRCSGQISGLHGFHKKVIAVGNDILIGIGRQFMREDTGNGESILVCITDNDFVTQ